MLPENSVAIVGVGGLFPNSPTLDRFWENIISNTNTSRRPPAGRWLLPVDDIYDPQVGAADKIYSQKGCFLDDEVDTGLIPGLDIDPNFLKSLDPMFRLLLRVGQQTLDSVNSNNITRERAGIIIGNLALPTEKASTLARNYLGRTFVEKLSTADLSFDETEVAPINHYVAGLPVGVLAKAIGFGGTCYTVDAACASSLYAIKLAVDELQSGRADTMLAGGLSRPDSLYTQMGFSQLRALSPTGTCSPFDKQGNGLVVGEGCGLLLLKRTRDALRDGDQIHAVIRGIGLSNDLGGSLLAPAAEGQLRAMRSAYKQAGWSPADVDLIECHATGTPVGDAVEFSSLQQLWNDKQWQQRQCVIGSVKANVGHLLTAAGAAATIKALLAINNKTLPPTVNYNTAADGIDFDNSPFHILDKAKRWETRKGNLPRRAAVSAFGFGGINAHMLLEEWVPQPPAKNTVSLLPSAKERSQPIAIVGMGANFGEWDNLTAFQQRVLGGTDNSIANTPTKWWNAQQSNWYQQAGFKDVDVRGYFMPQVFSHPGDFRIPPKEQEEMLPRQLLMLQVAAAALNDAKLGEDDLLFAGVYIGSGLDQNATNFSFRWGLQKYARQWAAELGLQLSDQQFAAWLAELRQAAGPPLTANRTMGALGSVVASRIAKEFRIGGPSFTLSSEENSGLRALEVGIHALQEGSINRAIVGAVDLAGDLRSVLSRYQSGSLAIGGTGSPFDQHDAGNFIGEGAAAVVLKRLDDAKQDGDRIYAVIEGVGTAIGGQVESNLPQQQVYSRAVEQACHDANVSPATISYLETDGSGITAIDRLEAQVLAATIGNVSGYHSTKIGSVKADIGNSGVASGLASLVKTALCLHQQILPPLRNLNSLTPEWIRGKSKFSVPTAPQFWLHNRATGMRRALVSGIGSDGSCSQLVVSEYRGSVAAVKSETTSRPIGSLPEGLFIVEAASPDQLLTNIAVLRQFIDDNAQCNIDILARLWFAEEALTSSKPYCLSLIAENRDNLRYLLDQGEKSLRVDPYKSIGVAAGLHLDPASRERIFYAAKPFGGSTKIAFVFPGSGNQFAGMGRELSARWPQIYKSQEQQSGYLADQYQADRFWGNELSAAVLNDHNALVISHVAQCTALSDLVRSFGINPNMISGYSLGESAGLFSSGGWSDRDEMLRRLEKSPLFTHELAGECRAAQRVWGLPADQQVDWVLGMVNLPAAKLQAYLKGKKQVYLLIINTHREAVIGGNRLQVEQLVADLKCHFIPLQGVTTVHCEVVRAVSDAYRRLHLFNVTPPANVDYYSCALGKKYPLTSANAADIILAQALDTINYPQVIEQLYADGARVFIEVGPGNSCSRMIASILEDSPHLTRSVCVSGVDPTSQLLRLLGSCLAERLPVKLDGLYPQLLSAVVEKSRIETTIGASAFDLKSVIATVNYVRSASLVPEAKVVVKEISTPLPQVAVAAAPAENETIANFTQNISANIAAHEAYLGFSKSMETALTANIALQTSLLQQLAGSGANLATIAPLPVPAAIPVTTAIEVAYNREMCLEFAVGSIEKMLGSDFAEVDTYPTRVRLPDGPLMLVDRILSVEGVPRSMTKGRVVTEHDVTADRWYLDGGRIPTCVAVEAGQADLFLSGYLGIDFITKGKAVYRLLDAVVTFHRSLPVVGDIIHYDIEIEEFFRQDQTYLFRFNFEGTVNGEPLLSMRKGCAGFFTAEDLAAGKGIVHTKMDLAPQPGKLPADWHELVPHKNESYSDEQINALYAGNLGACFGAHFSNLPFKPYTMPGDKLKLVDRVIELDPHGGRYGIGQITAEMDINPDDWFLTCHFIDDQVMPGTLMYECCLHTLRIFLLRMGWVGAEGTTWCEPVPGVGSGLKCRGQVLATTKKVTYRVSIKEMGYRPEPYAIVDALMFADDQPIVEIPDMSVRLAGLDRQQVEALWSETDTLTEGQTISGDSPKQILYDTDRITAFAIGKPSDAFGEPYRIFDNERKIARLPGPPLQFIDRIVAINGEPWKLVEGVTVTAEYDVPVDAWYFNANRQTQMPFCVLLEIGLQPCGWLAGYLGSALTSETDLSFRNLDGNAVQHRPVTAQSGTLTIDVKITRIASSGGMIIQSYDFAVSDSIGPVYTGDTVFGFFSKQSLAQQVGVQGAKMYQLNDAEKSQAEQFNYPSELPYPDTQMSMVDEIEALLPQGGIHNLGYIRGNKIVDPDEWLFKAHFYQDPVCPGSLGLESFLQLLKVTAAKKWGVTLDSQFESVVCTKKHSWNYRGQIIPANKKVLIEAVVTAVDDENKVLQADGFLSVDGKIIYQLKDFSLKLLK